MRIDVIQQRVFKRLAQWLQQRLQPSRWRLRAAAGVYLWGQVGRGKSLLLDAFFSSVDGLSKRRVHVHELLQDVQQRMLTYMGQPDPLARVADDLADQAQLWFIDEFHVHDIGDAIMLGRLLGPLIERGCTLLLSSNYAPEHLCANPLYHSRFKPYAELIKRQCLVLHIEDGPDYRARSSQHWGRFVRAEPEVLVSLLGAMAGAGTLELGRRQIQVRGVQERCIWLDFAELCQQPLASSDYLRLCERYSRIVVSHVPVLASCTLDELQRLINFIDIAYDRRCELWLHAQQPLASLAADVRHGDFSRTLSRLAQLQSWPAPL